MTVCTLRNIALKLYKYFLIEDQRARLMRSIHNPKGRVRDILEISKRTMNRWLNQAEGDSTRKPTRKSGPKSKLDGFDLDVIKREITRLTDKGDLITLRKLKQWLQTNNDIELGKTSLWKAVRKLGFTFRNVSGLRSVLCERENFVGARSEYIRKVRKYREEDFDIVYLDETFVNAHHTVNREWVSKDGSIKRHVPSGKGRRIIVAHAGSENVGFIPQAELVFTSVSTDNRDYHSEMNSDIFEDWIENTLLPALDRPSCIVMDNASYHSLVLPEDKIPTTSTRKEEIQSWLEREKISYDKTALKGEPLSLVRVDKKRKQYKIDKLISQHGHVCLRLPPYHSHLNPIELVWAKVKGEVADKNKTFKLEDMRMITKAALNGVDKSYLHKCVQHVQKNRRRVLDK